MTDAGHDVGGRKRGLLDFGKIILRIAVELEPADLDQRVILVRPYFRKVEGVVPVLADIALRHDLHRELPAREITTLDGLEQVTLVGLAGMRALLCGFAICPVS